MVPVHTAGAFDSPFEAGVPDADGQATLSCDGKALGVIRFPSQPRFYGLKTAEGVPYSQIATLHGRDVLATTVLQTCIRYQSRTRTCQFAPLANRWQPGAPLPAKRLRNWPR
jgi:hypothetical protein